MWCVPLTAFHVLDRPCPTGINPAGHGAQPFQDAVEFSLLVFFEDFHVGVRKGWHPIVLLSCSFSGFGARVMQGHRVS